MGLAKPKLETVFSFGDNDEHELQYASQSGLLYLNGDRLVTEKRFSNFERGLAVAGLIIGTVGVLATLVQAWFAAFPPAVP